MREGGGGGLSMLVNISPQFPADGTETREAFKHTHARAPEGAMLAVGSHSKEIGTVPNSADRLVDRVFPPPNKWLPTRRMHSLFKKNIFRQRSPSLARLSPPGGELRKDSPSNVNIDALAAGQIWTASQIH